MRRNYYEYTIIAGSSIFAARLFDRSQRHRPTRHETCTVVLLLLPEVTHEGLLHITNGVTTQYKGWWRGGDGDGLGTDNHLVTGA
jgi:hypothetical protein